MGIKHKPTSILANRDKPTLEKLQAQLAQADETAIALYEEDLAQQSINAAQDDALIEIYEMIGGV